MNLETFYQSELRRNSRDSSRQRTPRSREGRIHRSGRSEKGSVREGGQRYYLLRRDRRTALAGSGEIAACPSKEGDRARGRDMFHTGRHPPLKSYAPY